MTISVTGSTSCIGIKSYLVFFGTNPAGGLASLGNTDICSSEPLNFTITGTGTNPNGTRYIFSINDGSQVYQHPPQLLTFFHRGSCGISSSNGYSYTAGSTEAAIIWNHASYNSNTDDPCKPRINSQSACPIRF